MKPPALRAALAAALCLVAAEAMPTEKFRLAPYKDELFRYPKILEEKYGGDFVRVEFDQKRDVVERDEKPDEKTRADYVSLDTKATETELVLRDGDATVKFFGAGKTGGDARIVVIFLHGLQATGRDGMNDWRSGGNLNRIKNLMVRNGGVYLSPDFSTARRTAKRQIAALIAKYAENSPGAPIFLVCASWGARICWDLAAEPATAGQLDGLLFIAATSNSAFLKSATSGGRPLPVYMGHGTRDNFVPWQPQEQLFRKLKTAAPDYPVKLVLFETGSHRTPLRMTDWRLILNWMLEVRERQAGKT
jgi:hypothetical protein